MKHDGRYRVILVVKIPLLTAVCVRLFVCVCVFADIGSMQNVTETGMRSDHLHACSCVVLLTFGIVFILLDRFERQCFPVHVSHPPLQCVQTHRFENICYSPFLNVTIQGVMKTTCYIFLFMKMLISKPIARYIFALWYRDYEINHFLIEMLQACKNTQRFITPNCHIQFFPKWSLLVKCHTFYFLNIQ